MMRRQIILVALLGLFSSLYGAVIPDVKFRRLDTREGLSSSQVNSILRDERGYVWFGTSYGLNRYDGYRIRTYFSYDKDTTSLRNNRIDEIQEGFKGRLWLKQGMGYSMYDPVTEKVDRSPSRFLNTLGIKGSIEYIHIEKKKTYWVKTYDSGFYYYNPENKKMSHLEFGYGDNEFPEDFGVSSCVEGKEGMIMVSSVGELICVDGERGTVVWKDDYVKRQLDAHNDYWVTLDKEDNIWVITHTKGTYIYLKSEHRWLSSLTEFMRLKGYENAPEDVLVWEVCYDAHGLFWVATDHLGVLVLDPETKEWRQFTNVKGDDTSLPDITIKHLYLDQLGRMWMASYKNGAAMCSDALSNFKSFAVGDINAITEDHEGYLWLGRNDGGILKMDPKTYNVVETYTKQSLGVPSDIIVGSYCARDGSLWFGTYEGGLLKYKDGLWKNYRASDAGSQFKTNNIWGITEDLWGNVWIGVLGGGAVRIDRHTGQQRSFTTDNSTLKTVWTNSISAATNGWILLGNSEYFAMINPSTMKVINGEVPEAQGAKAITVSAATSHAIMDSRRLIWLCSSAGVAVYDRKHNRTTLLDMKSGLHGSNTVSVTEDLRGTIWVATDHGVSNIIPQQQPDSTWTFIVRSFNDRDGLQPGPFNQRAIYMTKGGDLLVGGQDGVDIINTTKLGETNVEERPVFSGLVLFDQQVEVGDKFDGHVILDEALDFQRSISLEYSENQFTIQMGSDNGGINHSTRFVYQLKGFNDKWIKTSANNPEITYMSLRPGSYTLCVRMLKDDGTMGEVESRLDITIASPWYQSWWAWLCYVLLALLAIVAWKYLTRQIDILKERKRHRKERAATEPEASKASENTDDDVEEAVLMDVEEIKV